MRELLADIGKRYPELDSSSRSGTGEGSRGAPGFGSRSPASDHIIAMSDPRSSADAFTWLGSDKRLYKESEHPPLSIFNVLDTIAWEIADGRRFDAPPTAVPALCVWIDAQLDWLTRQPSLVRSAWKRLRRLSSQLKQVTGEPRIWIKIGPCPNTIDEGETTRTCGNQLFAPATRSQDDRIRCSACRRSWPRRKWSELGDLLEHPPEPELEQAS